MERRNFLKGALAGTGLAGTGALMGATTACAPVASPSISYPLAPRAGAPNIVVIVVDQMRFPKHFPAGITSAEEFLATHMPNVHGLWTQGVPFAGHHTAAQACTPARNTMVTGLHARQTYMLNTRIIDQDLTLHPDFPTYGKLLRQSGYRTPWIGKWHLSKVDSTAALETYGFSASMAPDPVGRPDGQVVDPVIADHAIDFLQAQSPGGSPFCATVSFINPHDKQFFWALLDVPLLQSKGGATCLFNRLGVQGDGVRSDYTDDAFPAFGYPAVPDNWESAATLLANKPYTQWVTRETFDTLFGTAIADDPSQTDFAKVDSPLFANDKVAAPYSWWARGMDMYTQAMRDVDVQVGRVIDSIPEDIRDDTVIVFVSDHGEYAGSHGMSGKAGSYYDEAVRVPLIVVDPRDGRTASHGQARTQLTSSLDLLPLLVSLAQDDGSSWKTGILDDLYGSSFDLLPLLTNPSASGRPYLLSSCDEYFRVADTEFFVVGVRTDDAKLVAYFPALDPTVGAPEVEFYDYTTAGGRAELDNTPSHPLASSMLDTLVDALIPNDLLRPLPPVFHNAQFDARDRHNFNRELWANISAGIVSQVC